MGIEQDVQDYLERLGEKLGIPGGRLNAAGEALIACRYEGVPLDVSIVVFPATATMSLSVPLGVIPDGPDLPGLLAALLAANVLGHTLQGLAFAVSPKDRSIHLGYSLLGPSQTYSAFETAFTRLLVLGAHWRGQFSATGAAGDGS